jgi:hypothetical protein
MRKPSIAILAAAVLATAGAAGAGVGACSQTALAARAACRAEAKDDFWIAVGVCNNVSDETARGVCLADAKASQVEAAEECGDQFEARDDLCDALGEAPYDPVIDPSRFLSPAATAADPNPYFPLVPGTKWVYEGPGETITVTITDDTREILGVTAIVVRDIVADEEGTVVEDTLDWYAQDVDGNVWYLGEISQSFEDGELSDIEGTWKSGVDSAKPGIVMEAAPEEGDVYRQEFALGNAEDAAEVLATDASESTPGASCDGDCLVTRDFTPLEPDAEEHKYYAPGIGMILEVDPESGDRTELVSMTGG